MSSIYSPESAIITAPQYDAWYRESIEEPEYFWSSRAKECIDWSKPWSKVISGTLETHDVKWFEGARVNASVNCLDRHLPSHGQQTAFLWEGDEPNQQSKISYQELYEQVCQLANGLKELGINKGDRVCIYLPMIIQAPIAMLACTRIGAVHSVVFGGFSAAALKSRINDAKCKLIITADGANRGGRFVNLRNNVLDIIDTCESVEHVLTIPNQQPSLSLTHHELNYHDVVNRQPKNCEPTEMEANDPLFVLYTSGSTGKAKGILHSTAGYLVHTALSFKTIFNYQPGDVYWCTADVGWITGHSYLVYGPLLNRATSLLFASTPSYPTPSRCWEVVDKHGVNIFYTAPTAIRALMREGDHYVTQTSRASLKLLGSVGEPINPDVWQWYSSVVGENRCPIVDTWWQTETGGIMLSPHPYATSLKPGSACKPFFGVAPMVINAQGLECNAEENGDLVITKPWPGMLNTIYGNHERFIDTYFSKYPGYYFTGDGAHKDTDGYYWISGRVDDVINVSGHRLETAEIESAIVHHANISEAAVVSFPHEIKGEGIYAFVTPKANTKGTNDLKVEIIDCVRKQIGPIAKPDYVLFTPDLPKTRSGKIMRRILRLLAKGQKNDFGDTSTLANPSIVEELQLKIQHQIKENAVATNA